MKVETTFRLRDFSFFDVLKERKSEDMSVLLVRQTQKALE